MRVLQTVVSSIRRSPGKTLLTLATVALGTGVLILALSVSDIFTELTLGQLNEEGIVLVVGNVEENSDGDYQPVRPSTLDSRIVDLLMSEVTGSVAASAATEPFTSTYSVDGQSYQVRSVLGTNASYFEIFGLQPVAGSFFTSTDVEENRPVAVVSESFAELVFGSAEAALGESLVQPSNFNFRGAGQGGPGAANQRTRISMPTVEIAGVYEDPSELLRDAYGVADVIIPLMGALPAEVPRTFIENIVYPISFVRVAGQSVEAAEAQIRAAIELEYGEDIALEVWEGTVTGESVVLERTRTTVATFTFVINLLGFILLVSGSIGIFSIMMVDVIGRTRDTALERALGASKENILVEFLYRSAGLSGLAAVAGILLAMGLSFPMRSLVLPFFTSGTAEALPALLISWRSVAIGVAASLLAGGVFGIIPVFTLLGRPIAESLREV